MLIIVRSHQPVEQLRFVVIRPVLCTRAVPVVTIVLVFLQPLFPWALGKIVALALRKPAPRRYARARRLGMAGIVGVRE
jgi:hypothetical protein